MDVGETRSGASAPRYLGVALANLVHGVPIDSAASSPCDFLNPSAVTVSSPARRGAPLRGSTAPPSLRSDDRTCSRRARHASRRSRSAALVTGAFLAWTVAVAVDRNDKDVFPPILPAALGILALTLAVVLVFSGRSGWTFAMTGVGTVLLVATLFTGLYPRVMVSSPEFAKPEVDSASSSHDALTVMNGFARCPRAGRLCTRVDVPRLRGRLVR